MFPAILADIDISRKRLRFCSAGFPEQYCLYNGTLTGMDQNGVIIGTSRDARYTLGDLQLQNGAKVILFTDGLLTQTEERTDTPHDVLQSILSESRELNPDQTTKHILNRLSAAATDRNAGHRDDITLICAQLQGVDSA
jgi:serine phosphatase RsbU (regulator of sigma subunit)